MLIFDIKDILDAQIYIPYERTNETCCKIQLLLKTPCGKRNAMNSVFLYWDIPLNKKQFNSGQQNFNLFTCANL